MMEITIASAVSQGPGLQEIFPYLLPLEVRWWNDLTVRGNSLPPDVVRWSDCSDGVMVSTNSNSETPNRPILGAINAGTCLQGHSTDLAPRILGGLAEPDLNSTGFPLEMDGENRYFWLTREEGVLPARVLCIQKLDRFTIGIEILMPDKVGVVDSLRAHDLSTLRRDSQYSSVTARNRFEQCLTGEAQAVVALAKSLKVFPVDLLARLSPKFFSRHFLRSNLYLGRKLYYRFVINEKGSLKITPVSPNERCCHLRLSHLRRVYAAGILQRLDDGTVAVQLDSEDYSISYSENLAAFVAAVFQRQAEIRVRMVDFRLVDSVSGASNALFSGLQSDFARGWPQSWDTEDNLGYPELYADWALRTGQADERQWALWVLKLAESELTMEKASSSRKALQRRFHPDTAGGIHSLEACKSVNVAFDVLFQGDMS